MKASKILAFVMVGLALSATPALAQRGGGGRSGGGGSHSSSSSMSRSSSSSSSRSSFSGGSSSSRSSFSSSPSRSSYSSSPSRSSSSVSRSSSSRSSFSGSRGSSDRMGSRSAVRSGEGSVRSSASSRMGSSRQAPSVRGAREAGVTTRGTHPGATATRTEARRASSRPAVQGTPGSPRSAGVGGERPSGRPSGGPSPSGYARPGHPGGHMPPSSRPIHPAPYFHHPWHGHIVHCHPIFWDPIPPRPWYWPGFWVYCNSYWYDYHVTDVVVVHDYVQQTYNVDMVTYGISGDIMYAIVRDGGSTYLQVYDKDDHLLAEQKINKKYCNMVIDAENGGCWISKKNNKDALLFIWADGQLLIYEAD